MNFQDKKAAVMKVLSEYDLDSSAVWNCHGTPVILHKALERVADKAKISFDPPHIVETNEEKKVAVICVTGRRGEDMAWSFGEAMPSNNKNSYPFAMAEKRGKDRVILKLIGLSGEAYSEDEADDFKKARPTNEESPKPQRRNKADSRDDYTRIQKLIDDSADMTALGNVWRENYPAIQTMCSDFEDQITVQKDEKKNDFNKKAA